MQSLTLDRLKQDMQLSPPSCPGTHPQTDPELLAFLFPPHQVSNFLGRITSYESIIRLSKMIYELNRLKVV